MSYKRIMIKMVYNYQGTYFDAEAETEGHCRHDEDIADNC